MLSCFTDRQSFLLVFVQVLLNLVATVVIPPVHDVQQTLRKLDRFVRLRRQLVMTL